MQYKIYLDQKDYSSIARGLCGDPHYELAARNYDKLKNYLESGQIKIFFSMWHIIESLKYKDLTGPLWDKHCEAIDTLTQGNCIISTDKLEKIELELFLSKTFGFESNLHEKDYAYGRYRDSIPYEPKQATSMGSRFEDTLKKTISESLLKKGLPRNDRRRILKELQKKEALKKYFSNFSQEEYKKLADNCLDNKDILHDFIRAVDKDDFLKFIFGNNEAKEECFNKIFDQIFQFKRLIQVYSLIFPQLLKMTESSMDFDKFHSMVKQIQLMHEIDSNLKFNEERQKEHLAMRFANSLKPNINHFSQKYNFSHKDACKLLIDNHFKDISSINSIILFFTEYQKKHGVKISRGRDPHKSDILDLYNLRNLPYVDIYLTDNYFVELSKKIGEINFNTKVLRNLNQLVEYLEKNTY